MSTTNLYVEQIVIGLETILWIILLASLLAGEQFINNVISLLNKLPIAIILLATCYVIGLIIDRLADQIFSFVEQKYKEKHTPNRDFSVDLFANYNHLEFFHYTQSRKRVLRASILNLPFLMIFSSLFCYKYHFYTNLIGLIVIGGLVATVGAFYSLCSVYDKYFKRACKLEIRKAKETKRRCYKKKHLYYL